MHRTVLPARIESGETGAGISTKVKHLLERISSVEKLNSGVGQPAPIAAGNRASQAMLWRQDRPMPHTVDDPNRSIGYYSPAMAVVQCVATVEDQAKVEIETKATVPE
ncbi:MAG TPA: hypothetical protein QF901_05930 [Gammaproteobacteria bacterium]|nr:hypothetical protein [Gammaproteobacteria bacterium]